ncbi:hypothetical protein Tco_0642938 [Tanacetum coccineum]
MGTLILKIHGAIRIHRQSLALASFLQRRYLMAEWTAPIGEDASIHISFKVASPSRDNKIGAPSISLSVLKGIDTLFRKRKMESLFQANES